MLNGLVLSARIPIGIANWTELPKISVRSLVQPTVAAVVAMLTLEACATAEAPPGKSQSALMFESNLCSRVASRRLTDFEAVYAQCMLNHGNTVRLSDGRVLEPYIPTPQYDRQTIYAPPRSESSEPEQRTELEQPSHPEQQQARPEEPAHAIANFQNTLNQYRELILKVAHPLGELDSESSSVQPEYDGAVIIYTMHWHGALKQTPYVTKLRFTIRYNDPSNIDTVTISVESTTGIAPPFFGTTILKNVALNSLSDRLKGRGEQFASVAVRALNSSVSVELALAELLRGLANST
jgi:hypothetical protein